MLAFGKENAKARISELENGEVKNPHAKTIDALTVALDISHEELAALKETLRHSMMQNTLPEASHNIGYSLPPLELDVNCYGNIVISHTDPWQENIERFEYYAREDTLMIICKDGTSKPFLSYLPDYVVDSIPQQKDVICLLYERGPQPGVLSREEYKLLYFA